MSKADEETIENGPWPTLVRGMRDAAEVRDSAEAGLITGAGDIDRESFEIFNIPGGTVFHWSTGENE